MILGSRPSEQGDDPFLFFQATLECNFVKAVLGADRSSFQCTSQGIPTVSHADVSTLDMQGTDCLVPWLQHYSCPPHGYPPMIPKHLSHIPLSCLEPYACLSCSLKTICSHEGTTMGKRSTSSSLKSLNATSIVTSQNESSLAGLLRWSFTRLGPPRGRWSSALFTSGVGPSGWEG